MVDGEEKKTAETPQILDCNSARYFWISWEMNRIQVGKGLMYGEDPFLYYEATENAHPVGAIQVASAKGAPGAWRFYQPKGMTKIMDLTCSSSKDFT